MLGDGVGRDGRGEALTAPVLAGGMRGTPPAVRLACGSLMVMASDVDAAGLHLYDAGGLHTRRRREFRCTGGKA